MTQPRIGIYPGTFDPITNGHADIIRRAIRIVDRLVIGVARNDGKGPLFPTDDRVEIVRDEVAHLENGDAERIEVRAFDSLLVDFARSVGATVVIRGLRAVSDFEYEFQMAGMNARLNPEIETVFLPRTATNSSRRASSRKSALWVARFLILSARASRDGCRTASLMAAPSRAAASLPRISVPSVIASFRPLRSFLRRGLLEQSVAERLAWATVATIFLWLAIWWALS